MAARCLAVGATAGAGLFGVVYALLWALGAVAFEGFGGVLILSAVAFGFVHAGNRGATWVSTLAIVLESGALMGLAYVATRTLWLPIGLHFGWNFTEGGIFGAAVSGGQYTGLVVAPLSGPPFITGGAFGPEASIAAVAVSLGASAAWAWFAISTGAWRRWRRAFATR